MAEKKRILIVEDVDDARDTYLEALATKGYQVEGAGTLQDALQLVNAKTYHVALVDIILGGEYDRTNRDGLKVLRAIQELDEGSQRVVLSGQDERQLVRDILKVYGAFDYLDKMELGKKGFKQLYEMISRALESCQIVRYGWQTVRYPPGEKKEPRDVLAFLAGRSDTSIWVDRCLRALRPKGGYAGLQRLFSTLCDPLAPLMPSINDKEPMAIDEDNQLVSGRFWSKGLGEAIAVAAIRAEKKAALMEGRLEPRWTGDKEITRYETADLLGFAVKLEGVNRNSFVDKIT